MPPSSSHPARPSKPYPARSVRWLLAVALLSLGWLLAWAPAAVGKAPTVLVSRVAGPITPVVADQLTDGVGAAERDGHTAFLLELDTPGGLDTSMREITQAFLGIRRASAIATFTHKHTEPLRIVHLERKLGRIGIRKRT